MYFLVDPIVLCLPDQGATSDEISDFIQHLMGWNEFITTNQGDDKFCCISAKCYEALDQAGRYPSEHTMQELIDNRRDLCFTAKDAYLACRKIIESACWPSFEDEMSLPLGKFAIDSEKVRLDPNLVDRVPEEIKQSFQETFGYVAYAKERQKNCIASKLHLLTHPIENEDKKIAIAVTLLTEADGEDGEDFSQVETDLPIVETPGDWLRHASLTDIWENTDQAINQVRMTSNINPETKLFPYTIGPGFNQSLDQYHFPSKSSLLEQCFRKIALLLAEPQIQDAYPLRTDEGANAPQRTENVDGRAWKAWRLRITEGNGSVYRLHYWKYENNYVFSNVVGKDNFDICNIDEDIVSQIS